MIKMNELHDKTPQQLNEIVIEIKNPAYKVKLDTFDGDEMPWAMDLIHEDVMQSKFALPYPDYCGDDALAFRLMVDNKICLIWESCSNHWSASEILEYDLDVEYLEDVQMDYGQYSENKNPNRAIVECFILMNQNKEA